MNDAVPVAELQRRLDMMSGQGIATGPMLDRMYRQGLLTERDARRLVGNYRTAGAR